jgi:hypothetical protein
VPPRKVLYTGKKAAAKAKPKPKPAAARPSSASKSASRSTSPPRSILKRTGSSSPSKGTSVRIGGKTSNRLHDFFKACLKAFEGGNLPRHYDSGFDKINDVLKKEGLATRLVGYNKREQASYVESDENRSDTDEDFERHFELDLVDVPKLTEEKIKKVVLAILKIVGSDHSLLAKINSAARKYEINAYLVPLTEGDFWCACD